MIGGNSKKITTAEKALLILGFFYAFIKPVGLLASFLALHFGTAKMPLRLWMLILCCVFFLAIAMAKNSDIMRSIVVWRFYFGFILFLPFFASVPCDKYLEKLTYVLIFSVFIEAFLINTIIPAEMMPNFPDKLLTHGHYVAEGNYQRPMSIAGVAAFSAVLFVILINEFLDVKKKITLLLLSTVVVLFSSGSGFLAFLLYYIKTLSIKTFFLVAVFVGLSGMLLLNLDIEYKGLYKISGKYIGFLIELKKNQITESIGDFSNIEFLIGGIERDQSALGGDFGVLNALQHFGLLGLLMYLIVPIICQKNKFPIFVLLLTSMHYPVAFSFVGQILFAYFVGTSMNKQTINMPIEKIKEI